MHIDLSNQNLTDLPEYIYNNRTIRFISCNNNNISNLDRLSELTKLEFLICHNNQLTKLNNLPKSLRILNCSNNKIREIAIPENLRFLICDKNQITNLSNLEEAANLTHLLCEFNKIETINFIPKNLKNLWCCNNIIKKLPNIPSSITSLRCNNNKLPYNTLEEYIIYKFKKSYYTAKYSIKIERYYMKYRNRKINLEILYSPNLPFYKQFISKYTKQIMLV